MMNPDKAIFSARSIARAGGRYSDGVDWTEMPFNSANFFLEDFVPESGFKFTLTKGCGCNTHGFLATTKEDVWFTECDCCAIQWGFCWVCFQDFEILGLV